MSISRVVMGADQLQRPGEYKIFFLNLTRQEGDDPSIQSHGISFSQFRCPERFFCKAILTGFPHVAEIEFTEPGSNGRRKISSYKVISEAVNSEVEYANS